MATNLGRFAMRWKETYNPATAYVMFDVVYLNGSSYLCIAPCTNKNPETETGYWALMGVGAYALALASGYTGSASDFADDLAAASNYAANAVQFAADVAAASLSASAAAASALQLAVGVLGNIRPRRITDIDDFTVDGTYFEPASDAVDSTVSLNTGTRELTVTVGDNITISAQAHKNLTYGRNIIMNTIFKAGTVHPQMWVRMNQEDTVGAWGFYKPTNSTSVVRLLVTNNSGGFSEPQSITIDGDGTADIEVSMRTFESLFHVVARQAGYVVGSLSAISETYSALKGVNNGLGSGYISEYKTYLKTMEIGEYINVICLGDSNTAGNGLTFKETYPAQLQNRFFEHNVSVINAGVSGNGVAEIVARIITDVYDKKVVGARNIVVLQIGTNDAGATTASALYASIIDSLVLPIQAQGFEVWLCTIPSRGDYSSALTVIKATNALILADTNADRIIDLYARTVDSSDALIASFVQADTLHFTERGAGIMASLVAGELYK